MRVFIFIGINTLIYRPLCDQQVNIIWTRFWQTIYTHLTSQDFGKIFLFPNFLFPSLEWSKKMTRYTRYYAMLKMLMQCAMRSNCHMYGNSYHNKYCGQNNNLYCKQIIGTCSLDLEMWTQWPHCHFHLGYFESSTKSRSNQPLPD